MAKTHDRPSWGSAGNVIGYTFKQGLNSHVMRNFELFIDSSPLDRYPSVYYKQGHATLDHQDPGNIGWLGGEKWECLFFGNVTAGAIKSRPRHDDVQSMGGDYAQEMRQQFKSYYDY